MMVPAVVVFFFINLFFIQQPSHQSFPTNIYIVTNSLYVILSLLLFKQMLQHSLEIALVKQSAFWFNTAVLFCSATMFLNMALLNYYAQHKWGHDIIFYFWGGNFVISDALVAVSLFVDKKEYESKAWELMT